MAFSPLSKLILSEGDAHHPNFHSRKMVQIRYLSSLAYLLQINTHIVELLNIFPYILRLPPISYLFGCSGHFKDELQVKQNFHF